MVNVLYKLHFQDLNWPRKEGDITSAVAAKVCHLILVCLGERIEDAMLGISAS
jgi:hypothetical protein